MMNTKHTPGPWHLKTVKTSCGICHQIGDFPYREGKNIPACVYVDYPGNGKIEAELLANAKLIAAAPELLEALKTAKWMLERDYIDDQKMAVIDAIDLTIQKATE